MTNFLDAIRSRRSADLAASAATGHASAGICHYGNISLRVGSPAATTRGFGQDEFKKVGAWMIEVVDALAKGGDTSAIETKVREEVKALTARFPMYSGPWG